MKISYIAPVREYTMLDSLLDFSIIERAVSSAIDKTIVKPLQGWFINAWIRFVGLSYWLCLAIATTGVICAILGIQKGKKLAAGSIVFYIIIRMVTWCGGL